MSDEPSPPEPFSDLAGALDPTAALAAAAHEIKNALGPLAMTLQLVERQVVAGRPVAAVDLAFARTQVRRLSRLVDDLLDLPGADLGRLPLRCRPTDVGRVVRDAADAFCRAHDARVRLELPEATLVANADDGRLSQVLANLLENAGRYAPADAPVVVAAFRVGDRAVRIEVRDCGPGVDPRERARIFERFTRGAAASQSTGVGIGLYLCRAIVEAHGGRIGVDGDPGAGATFWLEIPAA